MEARETVGTAENQVTERLNAGVPQKGARAAKMATIMEKEKGKMEREP